MRNSLVSLFCRVRHAWAELWAFEFRLMVVCQRSNSFFKLFGLPKVVSVSAESLSNV